jgi:hypothetical protein
MQAPTSLGSQNITGVHNVYAYAFDISPGFGDGLNTLITKSPLVIDFDRAREKCDFTDSDGFFKTADLNLLLGHLRSIQASDITKYDVNDDRNVNSADLSICLTRLR